MAKEKPDYRTMMVELQQILEDMQGDGLDVDTALKQYARGQALIADLTKYLEAAENTITVRKAG